MCCNVVHVLCSISHTHSDDYIYGINTSVSHDILQLHVYTDSIVVPMRFCAICLWSLVCCGL